MSRSVLEFKENFKRKTSRLKISEKWYTAKISEYTLLPAPVPNRTGLSKKLSLNHFGRWSVVFIYFTFASSPVHVMHISNRIEDQKHRHGGNCQEIKQSMEDTEKLLKVIYKLLQSIILCCICIIVPKFVFYCLSETAILWLKFK